VHAKFPDFTFMAEVYWDLEWTLQQQGFAYCYDKRLYDRLRDGHAAPVRGHLLAGLDYQDKLARFLENHDEPRAASEFSWPQHAAAAIITFSSPGLRFFHQGQFDGARLRIPTHLCRGPLEPRNPEIAAFYGNLLQVLKQIPAFRDGAWSQIQPQPAWSGNWTSDNFIANAWAGDDGSGYLVVVNYAGNQGQCRLPLPFLELSGRQVRLTDLLGSEIYDRDGGELVGGGLYIDHAPWHFNLFVLDVLQSRWCRETLPPRCSVLGSLPAAASVRPRFRTIVSTTRPLSAIPGRSRRCSTLSSSATLTCQFFSQSTRS
jgi:hypothetical protein